MELEDPAVAWNRLSYTLLLNWSMRLSVPTFLAETWSVGGWGGSGKWYSRVTDSDVGEALCPLGWLRVGFLEGGHSHKGDYSGR